MQFTKYHGLGNDYLVVEPSELSLEQALQVAPQICHRNYGAGSDGILLGPFPHETGDFALRIINPDGSEAEKSGNGLRIFARYLWDTHRVGETPFTIHTPGGIAHATVSSESGLISMSMGTASFQAETVGIQGVTGEVVGEPLEIGPQDLSYTGVTVGNPHCVILGAPVTQAEAVRLGPLVEMDPRFVARTNVQLLKILDAHNVEIQIWERGAGYTLASGSSASAAASAAIRLGLCESPVTVHMPGGTLALTIDREYFVTQTGPAERVFSGRLESEVLNAGSKSWTRLPPQVAS